MVIESKVEVNMPDGLEDSDSNPNTDCYEVLAPYYEDIYRDIDATETVRQWWSLLVNSNLIIDIPEVLRLIDVGCGPGWHMKAWRDLGLRTAGLDSSPSLLALARKRLEDRAGSSQIYCTNILDINTVPKITPCSVAVSHFNFLNLFSQRQREDVFRAVARLVRPGGVWIADYSEPRYPPKAVRESVQLSAGVLKRKGLYNSKLGSFDQYWYGLVHPTLERYWFGHQETAESLALRTGWRLCLRKAWRPYLAKTAWGDPQTSDEIFVDVYQRMGGAE